jgi:hypothetical protein
VSLWLTWWSCHPQTVLLNYRLSTSPHSVFWHNSQNKQWWSTQTALKSWMMFCVILLCCQLLRSHTLHMSMMVNWWDDTERGKPKYSQKNLCRHHFVRHKSHIDWLGIEAVPLWWQARDCVNHSMAKQLVFIMKTKCVFCAVYTHYM